jgi:uncharacterized membrane protein YhaH (DUF805 family)
MNFSDFTRFSGRISRKSWWIGNLVLLAIAAALSLGISANAGYGIGEMTDHSNLRDEYFMKHYLAFAAKLQVLVIIVLIYPLSALMGQRLNDRSRPRWLIVIFWLPTLMLAFLGVADMAYKFRIGMPYATSLLTAAQWLSYAIGLWAIVELGFLDGNDRSKRLGQDPNSQ